MTRERTDALFIEYTPFLYGVLSPAPLVLTRFARAIGLPCTAIVHEAFHGRHNGALRSSTKARYFALRDRAVLSAADRIVVPSVARREHIASRLPQIAGRMTVMRIGANFEPAASYARSPARDGPHEIVAFGLMMPRHRFEFGIEALALLRGTFDARLTIVGRPLDENYARTCAARAAELGVGDYVTFTGALDVNDVSTLFARAHVGLFATREGATGSAGSLLALLAHGLPIVAVETPADEPAFRDVLLRTDESPQSIADGMARLFSQPQEARDLAARALSRYRNVFGWDCAARALTNGYLDRAAGERVVCS